jgi:hypothetical protein
MPSSSAERERAAAAVAAAAAAEASDFRETMVCRNRYVHSSPLPQLVMDTTRLVRTSASAYHYP